MNRTSSTLTKVYGAGFLFNVSYLTFAVLVPLDALDHHLPIWLVGVLASIPGILQLPTRIVSGPMVDRLGGRLILWITFACAILASLLVVLGAEDLIVFLIAGQLAMGAARGFFWTAAQSEVGRQPGDRARYLGLFTSFTKGGGLVGIAAAGGLAELVGVRGAFAFSGTLSLLAFIFSLLLPKYRGTSQDTGFSSAIKGLWSASLQPFVVVNGLVAILTAVPQALAQSFYPVVLIRLGLSQTHASLITALMSLGMIISGLLGATAIKGLGMKRLVLMASGLVALSLLATSLHQVFWDACAIFVGGFAAGWLNVAFLTAVSSHSTDADRGTNLGVTQVYFVLATMLTPLLSGWLLTQVGRPWTFVAEGAMALVVLGLIAKLWKWQQAREVERAPQSAP